MFAERARLVVAERARLVVAERARLVDHHFVSLGETETAATPDLRGVRISANLHRESALMVVASSVDQILERAVDAAGGAQLRPPTRPITLRHLLTHTAGFTYDIWNADMIRYQKYASVPGIIECRNTTLLTPLVFDPGDRWEYGINIDWVGKTVEHLSGQSIEDYFREHIFGPLSMVDSGFVLQPERRSRVASMHARRSDGSLQVIPFEIPQEPEFFMGGGGLYSTGPDYLRFLRMLLGRGELDGARVLRPETVDLMGENHIGELNVGALKTAIPSSSNDAEFFPGMVKKWGLGYMICAEEAPTGRGAGSLAWAGLGNTYFWIDPGCQLTGLILTQILPFADAKVLDLFGEFERAIYTDARVRGIRHRAVSCMWPNQPSCANCSCAQHQQPVVAITGGFPPRTH
jgi:methyl acetate hydrolase